MWFFKDRALGQSMEIQQLSEDRDLCPKFGGLPQASMLTGTFLEEITWVTIKIKWANVYENVFKL